jgi:membrane-bound lytic murein transglycosylase F
MRGKWQPWAKLAIVGGAVTMLATCAPVPGLIDQIKALGELRVVTRSAPAANATVSTVRPAEPDYEFAQRFADQLGVRLKVTAMRSYADIYAAVSSGRAHLAAAGLKIPGQPIAGVAFGPSYQHVREHLIYRHGAIRPASLAEIGDGDLEINADTAHAVSLREQRKSIPDLVWVENSSTDTQALLDRVANGEIDYTIADSAEFALAHDVHPELRIAFDFPGFRSVAWAAGDSDSDFMREIAGYFGRLNATGELAAIIKRSYGRATMGRSERIETADNPGFMRHLQSRLPLYRKWFEEAGLQSSQDWRLLAAMGYQESKWNPGAASSSGAKGLMQLTDVTATAAKVANSSDPRESIFGGARYFRMVYQKIPAHVPEPDRTWFALAAYNIGYGHLEDARVLAQKAGRDPDAWADVREFLPLLEQEYWYSQTANGYARGWEPVRYVDNVRNYRDLLEWTWGEPTALN